MANQFDEIAKALAQGVSRREMLRLLTGGVFAGTALAVFGTGEAAAAPANCGTYCKRYEGTYRVSCLKACARCRGDVSRLCPGGEAFVCCASGTSCCSSQAEAVCCPSGTSCCYDRRGAVTCCPEDMECCGGGCCPPGQCCESQLAPSATCCPSGETCCYDPALENNRCGTLDPTTGNCVPVPV
jgi:hypothetical protein